MKVLLVFQIAFQELAALKGWKNSDMIMVFEAMLIGAQLHGEEGI